MKLSLSTIFLVLFFNLILNSSETVAANVAVYSEATDVFELIDNVSGWHPMTSKSYRQEWERKFPLTLEDKSMLEQYGALRKKFAKGSSLTDPTSVQADVFGKSTLQNDFFSEAFYSSKSIGEALKKLRQSGLSASEISFLKKLYSTNKKKIAVFVSESSQFAVKLLALNKNWKRSGLSKVGKKLAPFILGKGGRRVKLLLRPVWWPSSMPPRVDVRGAYLILRYHPLAHTGKWNMEAVADAMVEALLQFQPLNQRKNLSKVFLARCRGRSIELQETLNILFSKVLLSSFKDKKSFNLYKKWSKRSFTDLLVKLLFPLLRTELKVKGSFAGRFMTETANLCRALNRLAVVP